MKFYCLLFSFFLKFSKILIKNPLTFSERNISPFSGFCYS